MEYDKFLNASVYRLEILNVIKIGKNCYTVPLSRMSHFALNLGLYKNFHIEYVGLDNYIIYIIDIACNEL